MEDLQSAVEAAVRKALEDSARGALPSDYVDAADLEDITGTPKATWRYWASIGQGPASFKLGRRRVWRRSSVEQWIAEQEATSV
jgi:prophage regulatory protein